MRQYLDLMRHILNHGEIKQDRTGTGTISVFGQQLRVDLSDGFPLLTTKKLHFKSIAHELLWFIRGESNIDYLHEHGVSIWDEWADEKGELGPLYGVQWRHWQGPKGQVIDQLQQVIEHIQLHPHSRRHIVSAWNVGVLSEMALPPCHLLFQFYVAGNRLSCQVYQRSADTFLGVPFNIASYALLLMLVAQLTGYVPGELVLAFGDVHLYLNHREQVQEQLSRTPRKLPKLQIKQGIMCIDDFTYDDFMLEDYEPYPHIKAPVAV